MAAEATAVADPQLVPIQRQKLAPPFDSEWRRVLGPQPPGYTASAQLSPATGRGVLKLAAEPHPPGAPTTIGWFWAGWERRVDVQLATAFTVRVLCNSFDFNQQGICIPRCFVTLRPLQGGPDLYRSVILSAPRKGHPPSEHFVTAVAPQSPNLPATVPYLLKVHLNLRAVFSKAQMPEAELDATLDPVERSFAFPTLEESPSFAAAAGDADLDPAELARALGELDRQGERLASE